jgi:hypothetical protein
MTWPSGANAFRPVVLGAVPGNLRGQHLQSAGFYKLLRHHGVPLRPARPASLIAFTGELPSPVVADLLDVHIHTAQQWADYRRSDWVTYLASRIRDGENA